MKYIKFIYKWVGSQSDTLIALSSMVIAVIALLFTIAEVNKNNEIKELSWSPRITWSVGKNEINSTEDSGFKIILLNQGLGPAELKWIQIFWKDVRVRDWDGIYRAVYSQDNSKIDLGVKSIRVFSNPSSGTIIKAEGYSSRRNILIEKQPEWREILWKNIEYITLTACACSLFGKCDVVAWSRLSMDDVSKLLVKNESSCEADLQYPSYFMTPKEF